MDLQSSEHIMPAWRNYDWFYKIMCYRLIAIGLFSVFLNACSMTQSPCEKGHSSPYSLVTCMDTLHYVQISTDSTFNQWELPYPVYQFQVGDIDNNGIDDMMVGVTKTTRFDPQMANRLFIFQNVEGYVRPLWLGSRLGKPLIDFCFIESKAGPCIRSIEQEKSGKCLIAEYQWRSFGLDFKRYIKREIDLNQAYNLLKITK